MRRTAVITLAILAAGCAQTTRNVPDLADERGAAKASFEAARTHRALVISFDALNERRVTGSVAPERIPSLRALFDSGACAASARPAFPSVTAAGHASLWTGVYGNVHGIAANTFQPLPSSEHTILETVNGFASAGLRAEPIWITAALAGVPVVGHHVTQAPQPPGYPVDDGEAPGRFDDARRRALRALANPRLSVVNGYNRVLMTPRIVSRADVQLTDARAWRGVAAGAGTDVAFDLPLDEDALVRGDSLHLLLRLHPARDSTQLFASFSRDLASAVRVMPHAEEKAPVRGRELARYFSRPVILRLGGGLRSSMRLRLFAVDARDTSFTLFVPGMQLADANRPSLTAAYDSAVPGWVGNSAVGLWESGALGKTLVDGGDGTAERRWMESAELLTRGFMEGSAWSWHHFAPRLQLDYFPLGDDIDHALFGFLDPQRPGYDVALAGRVAALRDRLWELVDLRFEGIMRLAREDGVTRLFVAGDHGMRATWRTFQPNAALREAGLLSVDANGRIDLARTRAASPNGYWITVNRGRRRSGIVAESDVGAVLDSVQSILLALRDEWGRPVVTRAFDVRDAGADSLGIGGPGGGDVYYEVADGLSWSAAATGPVLSPLRRPMGTHGFPSVASDMQTVSCTWGAGVEHARTPVTALTRVVPHVMSWLGTAERR